MASNEFRLGVLVSGRGSNLQSIIDQIESGDLSARIALVLTNKESARARDRAKKHGIEEVFIDPKAFADKEAYDQALVHELKQRQVDLVCLAGYMKILTPAFIREFPERIINIHPSLLPAFPGLNVQQKAIDYGVKFSGCTVHFVDEQVDTGPIILQATVPVLDSDDADSLANRILEQEHIIYPKAIQMIAHNRIVRSGRQITLKETS